MSQWGFLSMFVCLKINSTVVVNGICAINLKHWLSNVCLLNSNPKSDSVDSRDETLPDL